MITRRGPRSRNSISWFSITRNPCRFDERAQQVHPVGTGQLCPQFGPEAGFLRRIGDSAASDSGVTGRMTSCEPIPPAEWGDQLPQPVGDRRILIPGKVVSSLTNAHGQVRRGHQESAVRPSAMCRARTSGRLRGR